MSIDFVVIDDEKRYIGLDQGTNPFRGSPDAVLATRRRVMLGTTLQTWQSPARSDAQPYDTIRQKRTNPEKFTNPLLMLVVPCGLIGLHRPLSSLVLAKIYPWKGSTDERMD